MKKICMVVFIVANFIILSKTTSQATVIDIGWETVSGRITSRYAEYNYGASYQYDIGFFGGAINVDIDIMFRGDDPGSNLLNIWESNIENRWNYSSPSFAFPVLFNVDWVTSGADQVVTVHDMYGGYNTANWYTSNSWSERYGLEEIGGSAAHEFGHYLGLYDEYWGGAINTDTMFTTTNALMADHGPTQDRYYSQFFTWLDGHDYIVDDSIPHPGPVPEPATMLLFGTGLAGLIGSRFRRKKKE